MIPTFVVDQADQRPDSLCAQLCPYRPATGAWQGTEWRPLGVSAQPGSVAYRFIRLRRFWTDDGTKIAIGASETREVHCLADQIDELPQATAGHAMHIKVTVEFVDAGKVEQDVVDRINTALGKVKEWWTAL